MTILLPSITDLDEVTHGLFGGAFADIFSVQDKIIVVQIAQAAKLALILDELPTNINIGIAETLAEQGGIAKIVGVLEEIDKSLTPVGNWFGESKIYWP